MVANSLRGASYNAQSLNPLPVSAFISQIKGQTETVLVKPSGATALVLDVEVTGFRGRPGDSVARTFVDGDVNTTTNAIAKTAHGLETGDGPYVLTTSGTLPAGLSLATQYWIVKVDVDHFKLATTWENAVASTPVVVDITAAAGGGTHTIGGVPAVAGASQTTGYGSILFGVGRHVLAAQDKFTVAGTAAGSILNYWWL